MTKKLSVILTCDLVQILRSSAKTCYEILMKRMFFCYITDSCVNVCILSQSYNASVFYFDNISYLAHVLNQLFLPDESSVSQASYHTMVLTICFQLFKKQTI